MGFDSSQRKEARTNGVTIVFLNTLLFLIMKEPLFKQNISIVWNLLLCLIVPFFVLECRYLKVLLNGL